MADKPRKAGRPAGKPERGPVRPRKVGGVELDALERLEQEGLLTAEGRKLRQSAGPASAPARGANPGGNFARIERTTRGERAARPVRTDRPERGPGPDRGPRPDRPGRGPRPEMTARPERGFGPDRGSRPERPGRGPRPETARPARPDRAFGGGGGGGYASVDEQLAQSLTRGPRSFTRRPRRDDREDDGLGAPVPARTTGPRPVARPAADRPTGRPAARPGTRPGADRPARPGADRPARTPARLAPRQAAPAKGGRHLNAAETEVAERLHKVMAKAGVASRRHSEELIQAGRVTVNGRVVSELGTKVLPGKDLIAIDGRALGKPENLVYLLLNKPKGYVTTLFDPQGRQTVTDLLGKEVAERVYPVGRLDYDTEGLLILTNDGDLANGLMHPAKQVRKTYIAKLRGVPGPAKIRALETGIDLDDGPTAPAEVKMIDVKAPNASTVSIRIHEGRNRQVRRMFEAIGHEVIHLKRTTLGPLHLKDLLPGQWRELTGQEIKDLYTAAGLKPRTPAARKERTGK